MYKPASQRIKLAISTASSNHRFDIDGSDTHTIITFHPYCNPAIKLTMDNKEFAELFATMQAHARKLIAFKQVRNG